MGFDDKAMAFAAMVLTINAVMLVGLGAVGIDFGDDNLFTWIDSAILDKADLAANKTFLNPDAPALDANISVAGITAEDTGSVKVTIPFITPVLDAAAAVTIAITSLVVAPLMIMEFLNVPLEIQVVIGVPLGALAIFGFYYLLIRILAAVAGVVRG